MMNAYHCVSTIQVVYLVVDSIRSLQCRKSNSILEDAIFILHFCQATHVAANEITSRVADRNIR